MTVFYIILYNIYAPRTISCVTHCTTEYSTRYRLHRKRHGGVYAQIYPPATASDGAMKNRPCFLATPPPGLTFPSALV